MDANQKIQRWFGLMLGASLVLCLFVSEIAQTVIMIPTGFSHSSYTYFFTLVEFEAAKNSSVGFLAWSRFGKSAKWLLVTYSGHLELQY